MIRVGRAARGMELRGFHATPVAGVFGAAAATASLLHSDADTIMHALGIAASRASGIAEYGLTGGSVKRLHAGLAAQSGIQAVRLASVGMTAPTEALEGKRGIVQGVTATGNPGILTQPLEPSAVLDTGFKLYTCCAGQHTVIDAMRGLIEENPELRADAVESIHVVQNAWEAELVGTIKEPTDVVTSQFSAAFALGLRLVRGSNAITEYTEANIKDPEILGIARRVSYEAQSPESPLDGFAPCRMSVTLKDGRVLENAVSFARGTPQMPLSRADLDEKFFGLNVSTVGEHKAREIADLVSGVEDLADAGTLARAMVSAIATD
jgi:2-methylcitrate dehydratase PrpD